MSTEEVLDAAPELPRVRRDKHGFNRTDVINAFQDAFSIIGGTTRLALWANANPDKFYTLYAKLLPAQSYQFTESTTRLIAHALPPSALDYHQGFAPPEVIPLAQEGGESAV